MIHSDDPLTGKEVHLINPGGYDKYRGVVENVFLWGNEKWADVDWEISVHPCTSPIQVEHLILAE